MKFTEEQSEQRMLQIGMPKTIVNGFVTIGKASRTFAMEEDYEANRPAKLGKVKLEDFAKAFAGAYNCQSISDFRRKVLYHGCYLHQLWWRFFFEFDWDLRIRNG